MKSTGITRPLDALGRVVIPMEIRENLKINPKDLLEIYVNGEEIVLKKYGTSCIFCSSSESLVEYEGKWVCKKCIDLLDIKSHSEEKNEEN